jgi:hypothetical protein
VLAMCDSELLNKTLRASSITFCISPKFYGEEKVDVKAAVAMIANATVVNLVGKNVVAEAIRQGYVHPEAPIKIAGVPHAQIVKMACAVV